MRLVFHSLASRVRAHIRWRVAIWLPYLIAPHLPRPIREGAMTRLLHPDRGSHWLRLVMTQDTRRIFESLNPSSLHVAEISGAVWTEMSWASRT